MPTYRFQFWNGYSAHMTIPQYEKACLIAQQWGLTHNVTVEPVFGMEGAYMINTGSMHIAVLPDGSSHS